MNALVLFHSGWGVGVEEWSRPSLQPRGSCTELWGGLPVAWAPGSLGVAGDETLVCSGENPVASLSVPQLPGSLPTRESSPPGTHPAASSRMWTKGSLRTWRERWGRPG